MPLFILWFFVSDNIQIKELGIYLLSLKFYGGVTLSVVFLYFYAQVIRITSKYFENKYFVKNLGFPTTYLMTYADGTFSKYYKDKYRERVKKHFDIDLHPAFFFQCQTVDLAIQYLMDEAISLSKEWLYETTWETASLSDDDNIETNRTWLVIADTE